MGERLEAAQSRVFAREYGAAARSYGSLLIELGRDESPGAREVRVQATRALADLSYLHLGDYARAAQLYRDLAERWPDRPETFEARVRLAEILQTHFHDGRAALAQLAALVQSFPDHPEADRFQLEAARRYFELRDWPQTETELRLLRKRWPKTNHAVDVSMLLGATLALQGRRDEAIATYREVTDGPDQADAGRAWLEIGKLQEEAGQVAEAESALAHALSTHPEPTLVARVLGRVKRRAALRRPVDLADRAAIFDHGVEAKADQGE